MTAGSAAPLRVGIIGGGAAGMMAASVISGGETVLFEKNEKLGKKMYITGKGRCNITNNSPVYEFVENIVNGKKFVYSSLTAFPPPAVMELLARYGVKTKTERGSRVFPVSDKSSDIINAFATAIENNGVTVKLNETVKSVTKIEKGFVIKTAVSDYLFDRVLIATGGVTYRSTGSTGDGYAFAKKMGHSITEPAPALSALELYGDVTPLEGLSLKNVKATVIADGKSELRFGEMLFTDTGVSGPIILTLSGYINRLMLNGATLLIDFKPSLSPETLDNRLLSDIGEAPNKNMANLLSSLLPKAAVPYVLRQSGINGELKANSLTKEKRLALGYSVKNLYFKIKGLADINQAIITSGGINLSEVNSKTMESRIVPGLFFAGELLDIDALTGGYNLQIALSTGYAAGKYITEEL